MLHQPCTLSQKLHHARTYFILLHMKPHLKSSKEVIAETNRPAADLFMELRHGIGPNLYDSTSLRCSASTIVSQAYYLREVICDVFVFCFVFCQHALSSSDYGDHQA